MRTSSLDEINKRMQDPRTGPNFGGLITDPILARVRKLEERMSKLEKLAYTNPSGCCCKFDEDGATILEVCKAHRMWKENK